MTMENVGSRFDRLPERESERSVEGRPTRGEVLQFFTRRFGMSAGIFASYTFWEKGKGKIWAFRGEVPSPIEVETLGIHLLRTRQRFWKPTTDGIQLLGRHATKNVVTLSREDAVRFWRGEDQHLAWDGDQGYVIVSHELGGAREPLGVGLAVDGELRSLVPKGRRRDLGTDP